MSIWSSDFKLEQLNEKGKSTILEHLGIRLTEMGEDFLRATMPVDDRTRQPAGVVHGGASVTLAETVGTWAATLTVDPDKFHCVGMEINANHIRPVSEGTVTATATPLHLGRTTQVWNIRSENEEGKLVCISRMTVAVLPKPSEY